MTIIDAEGYHEMMVLLYHFSGVDEILRTLGIPDGWPIDVDEIQRAIAGHVVGSQNCIDAVTTAQVAKIARLLGASPQDSQLLALAAVFKHKPAVER